MHLVGALMQFRDELAQQHQHPSFAVNVPTLNLGLAGDNPNRIWSCRIATDLCLLPGMDSDAIHKQLEQRCPTLATTPN